MRGGDLTGARHDIDTAERAAWERGQPMLEIDALGCLAELHRRSGDTERSEQELDHMEAIAATHSRGSVRDLPKVRRKPSAFRP